MMRDWDTQTAVMKTTRNYQHSDTNWTHSATSYSLHVIAGYSMPLCLMPATHTAETGTRNWYQSSDTRNLHVCRSIRYQFFSGTSFLHAKEHSSIPAQKLHVRHVHTNRAMWLAGELFSARNCDELVSNYSCKFLVTVSGVCVTGISDTLLFVRTAMWNSLVPVSGVCVTGIRDTLLFVRTAMWNSLVQVSGVCVTGISDTLLFVRTAMWNSLPDSLIKHNALSLCIWF